MTGLRAAWAIGIALALAACANTAPPDAAPVVPAQAGTHGNDSTVDPRLRGDDGLRGDDDQRGKDERRPPPPPTGGPHPPQRYALACKVDADCTDKPHCKDAPCRCVRETCIAHKDPIDPVVDPAPVPPPET